MRFTFLLPLALLATAAVAAPGRDDQLKPVSLQMAAAGHAALAAGKPQDAIDSFEAALASDPRNVGAFAGIAAAYEKLGLPGKAPGVRAFETEEKFTYQEEGQHTK